MTKHDITETFAECTPVLHYCMNIRELYGKLANDHIVFHIPWFFDSIPLAITCDLACNNRDFTAQVINKLVMMTLLMLCLQILHLLQD